MTPVGSFVIGADHPSLPGHFPGRPVVPGVVLLDHALSAILTPERRRGPLGLPVVKFIGPVRAGATVVVACAAQVDDRISFSCAVDGVQVVRGVVSLA